MGPKFAISRRAFLATFGSALPLAACESIDPSVLQGILQTAGPLTQGEAAQGIKQALSNGVLSALLTVGKPGGYWNNGKIRIPLPQSLQKAQNVLAKVGASGMLDEVQEKLNQGAEQAAPQAKSIFLDAVTGLSIPDAIAIVQGGEHAATDYLQNTTTPKLTALFTPIMKGQLRNTGAFQALDDVTARVNKIPFAGQLVQTSQNDLVSFGVEKGLDGVFYYIGQEEAAIRANPAKRTSEILRRVFG